jgi:hypothetical protein
MIRAYYTVTLPEGVKEGQTIHVQAPDGKINAIVIPPGFGPGSTFTVEFAPEEKPTSTTTTSSSSYIPPTSTEPPKETNYHTVVPPVSSSYNNNNNNNNNDGDDGFATGFNNPHYRPPQQQQQQQVPIAHAQTATTNFSDEYYSQYPTATQPVTSVGYK